MRDDHLHAIHAASMGFPRPWSAAEIGALRRSPAIIEVTRDRGFALARVVLDETELLTLAVHPSARRRGIGSAIVNAFHAAARTRGATRSYLDVAATNAPAIALYERAGYSVAGRRPAYYTEAEPAADAILMARDL